MTANLDKTKQLEDFERIMTNTEERVTERLAKRAEDEGWTVEQHPGYEHGVDLKLQKGNRIILIEAKGERPSQTRHGAVRGALGTIIMHMRDEGPDRVYCVAFPSTEHFTNLARSIPMPPRRRLGLNIILVEDTELLSVLRPNTSNVSKLNSFDELF